jgi:DNA helicase HerA-like ATPase
VSTEGFYLGGVVDPASGDRTDVRYDGNDLTTHGVVVGMTGSGKTGLGVVFLEEALLAGVPALILDPKGDMTNLLLTFPDLAGKDFAEWVQPRSEGERAALAEETAQMWKKGLEGWGLDGDSIAALRDAAGFTVYTPGSTAGVPINIVGSLDVPDLSWETEAETLRDDIQGFVSGLLGLVGIAADPISSREHILLSNLIEHSWREGRALDLATLLGRIQSPPFRKLGVFEIDTFFPEKDRTALAMKLNGLVASPAFASWMEGPPLDVASLLWGPDGTPRASIIYLAHLSDEERQFIVTLLLSSVITWMRSQSGTGDLRALVYMDEVFGFVPPTAEPPAKKPILTLLKQARAFGVGMLLSTQNPVDLDYKAMSNAGTWCVGRLQTERDKKRIVEALKSARGDGDVAVLDAAISALGKRQFLLHSTRSAEPTLFTTRWAMSYLRGPLTREEVSRLQSGAPAATAAPTGPSMGTRAPVPNAGAEAAQHIEATAPPDLGDDETPVMPKVAPDVPIYHLDPAAPWASDIGGRGGGRRLEAALAARVELVFDERTGDIEHRETWEAVFHPIGRVFEPGAHHAVDYDPRDFTGEPPAGAAYALPEAPIDTAAYFRDAARDITEWLYRNRKVEVLRNAGLGLYSRVGESREDFLARCDEEAQRRADEETAKMRDKYRTKLDRVRDQLEDAHRRAADAEADLQGRRQDQLMDGAGAVIGILMGRRSTRSITGSSRSRSATRSAERKLTAAHAKVQDRAEEVADLEREVIAELEEINDRWEAMAEEIESMEVGLEKNDIHVDEVALVWVPTR